jgi:hypothetical protein
MRGEAGMINTNLKDKQKPLVLYPLSIDPTLKSLDDQVIFNAWQKNNVFKNVQEIEDRGIKNFYSIIADSLNNGYINGRFVKLKTDNIETINKITKDEGLEVIGDDKYIEANSYFIWDTKNNIMLAQWNIDSLNVLTKKAGEILTNLLKKYNISTVDVRLVPIPSQQLISDIIRQKGKVHKYFLKFTRINKPYFESAGKDEGITDTLIWDLANRGSMDLSLNIKLINPITLTQSFFDKLKNIANKNKKMQKRFGVYTDEGNFDLLGDKYVYYTKYVDIGKNLPEYRNNVYKAINDIYAGQLEAILRMIKTPNTANIEEDP